VESSQAVERRGRRECPETQPVLCIERVYVTRSFGNAVRVLRLNPQEQAVERAAVQVGHHQPEIDHFVVARHEPGGLDIHESEKPPGGVFRRSLPDHGRPFGRENVDRSVAAGILAAGLTRPGARHADHRKRRDACDARYSRHAGLFFPAESSASHSLHVS
jgi:hypothetical protein